ncbi:MAG: NADH-quinone oxidoreductase subunit [Actinomycetota bacterium]
MGQYLPIVVLATLAVLFGAISLVASKLLAPRRPNTAKSAPYECGIVPSREAPERFPVSFYIIAMLFIMFDIEIIFVYPYAVSHAALGSYVFFEMLAFSAVFFSAFVYAIARGALDWGPIKKAVRLDDGMSNPMTSDSRTFTSTIRRVGFEGRNEGAAA